MTASVALAPAKLISPIYPTGMPSIPATAGALAAPLPRNFTKIMTAFVLDWYKGDIFAAISNAVFEFYEAHGESFLTHIAQFAETKGVDPDVINQAVENGRDRWTRLQPPAPVPANNDRKTAPSDNNTPSQKIDADNVLRERGALGTASTPTAKPKRNKATKNKIMPFEGVPTSPPYTQDQKEYFSWQFAGDAASLTPTQRLIGTCLALYLNKQTG